MGWVAWVGLPGLGCAGAATWVESLGLGCAGPVAWIRFTFSRICLRAGLAFPNLVALPCPGCPSSLTVPRRLLATQPPVPRSLRVREPPGQGASRARQSPGQTAFGSGSFRVREPPGHASLRSGSFPVRQASGQAAARSGRLRGRQLPGQAGFRPGALPGSPSPVVGSQAGCSWSASLVSVPSAAGLVGGSGHLSVSAGSPSACLLGFSGWCDAGPLWCVPFWVSGVPCWKISWWRRSGLLWVRPCWASSPGLAPLRLAWLASCWASPGVRTGSSGCACSAPRGGALPVVGVRVLLWCGIRAVQWAGSGVTAGSRLPWGPAPVGGRLLWVVGACAGGDTRLCRVEAQVLVVGARSLD